MTKNGKNTDAHNRLKNKIEKFLLQEKKKNGGAGHLSAGPLFKTAKAGFYLFGTYGVFASLLHLLILYMALTSSLTEQYKLVYRSFVFPCVLLGVLCLAALVSMALKKETAAAVISLASAFPLILQFLQMSGEKITASSKPGLLIIYAVLFVFPLCSAILLLLKNRDKNYKNKILASALAEIYTGNGIEDGVMSEEQLLKAIDAYVPHL